MEGQLYLQEQAPWERKREYHSHLEIGYDVKDLKEMLESSTKKQIQAQLASASAIVASQERTIEGISNLSNVTEEGFERMANGLDSLQASFEWGISEVVWQLEQNRDILENILEVLMAPLDTKAQERRKRAEKAYSNGLIEDAEEEFLESEKLNKFDFSIHISLGMIYLFHKIDKEKALEYFEKAIKYARPESKYYTSFSLLYKALIKRDMGLIDEAEKCTYEAIELSPDLTEAYYQNAQYNALIGNSTKSVKMLKKAIEKDPLYSLKADNDEAFKKIENAKKNLFVELCEEIMEVGNAMYEKNKSVVENINNALPENYKNIDNTFEKSTFKNQFLKIKNTLQRNSFLDAMEAIKLNKELQTKVENYRKRTLKLILDLIDDKKKKIDDAKTHAQNNIERNNKISVGATGIIGGALLILPGFKGCMAVLDYGATSPSTENPALIPFYLVIGLLGAPLLWIGLVVLGALAGMYFGKFISSIIIPNDENKISPQLPHLLKDLKELEEKSSIIQNMTLNG